MALKITYPEPGDNVPQWATEDTQLQIKAILEKASRPTSGGNKADKEKEEQTKKSTKALKGLSEGFDELTGLVGTTAGVLTSTRGEFKDLIPIVDNFGNLLKKAGGAALEAIPIIGDAFAKGGEILVEFTKDAFSFIATTADTVADAFRETATRGAFFNNSLAELIKSSTAANISLEELSGILEANTSAIASFGDANKGARQVLIGLARVQDDFGDQLFNLGLNFQEINESASGFFELLATTGQARLLRAGQEEELANQTNRYIRDLTILASITGQERKEVEAEFRRQVQRGNVQAQLALLSQNNTEGSLQAFGNLSTLLTSFNPILGDAFGSIATLGVATAEQEAVLAQLGNARQLIEQFGTAFREGTLTDAEAQAQTEAIFKAISEGVRDPNFLQTAALGTGPVTGLPATLAEVASTALPLAESLGDTDFSLGQLREQIEAQATTNDGLTKTIVQAQKDLAELPFDIQEALLGPDGGGTVLNDALKLVSDNVSQFSIILQEIVKSGGSLEALAGIITGRDDTAPGGNPNTGTDKAAISNLRNTAVQSLPSDIENRMDYVMRINNAAAVGDMATFKKEVLAVFNELKLPIDFFQQGTQGVQNFGNGTLAMLHGNEAVIPAPRGEIPVDLGNTLQPLQDTLSNLVEGMRNTNTTVATNDVNMLQSNDVVQKLETMIGVLKSIADGTAQGNTMFGKEIRRLGNQMSADLYR
jgi:hypothetical protein